MLTEKVHIAVPTAFLEDESLHIQGTISHIKHLYKQGVKSVLVSGTTGEQHSLNLKEKIELINSLEQEEELISNMEIIFGVSSIRQKEAEELAQRIRNTRLSGMMLGYPPYVMPTQEEALAYSKSIIQYSDKPTILYNNPKRTGFDLSTNSIIQLSKLDLVVGIKDAGNKEKVETIKDGIHKNALYFYAGGEVGLEEKVAYGYDRLSSIAGNISPLEISEWFQKMLEGRKIRTLESEKIASMIEQLYQVNAIVHLKEIINRRNIPMGICRSPIGSN